MAVAEIERERMPSEPSIIGLTGARGVDGILTSDLQQELDTLQYTTAVTVLEYLERMEEGDLRPLIAMATGVGKTPIGDLIVKLELKENPKAKTLFIAGTKLTLVKQTRTALSGYAMQPGQEYSVAEGNGISYIESEDIGSGDDGLSDDTTLIAQDPLEGEQTRSSLYRTGKYGDPNSNVHVATMQSIQSLHKRGILDLSAYDLIIVDEVHNIGTRSRLEALEGFKRVIGFTATPQRSSGAYRSPKDYGFEVIASLPLPEAQEQRFLPPLVGMQINTADLVDTLPMTPSGAIDFAKLEKILKASPDLRPYIADRVARAIKTPDGQYYKTVMAVNFVWEAEELALLLKDKGIKVGVAVNQQAAKQIHSEEIPAVDSIERYKLPRENQRSIDVLISPYVASEGFDAPFTEVLVWASPTDSPLRYTQYTGRTARRHPGKRFALVIDCLYQTSQYNWSYNFGMWMKGNVRQLENGFLYLGPEQDIEGIKDLPIVKTWVEQGEEQDKQSIDKLQEEGLLQVQPGELMISQKTVPALFRGDWHATLQQKSDQVLNQLRGDEKTKGLVVRRKSKNGQDPTVVTDPEVFIQLMIEQGAELKDQTEKNLLKVQPGELMISRQTVPSLFRGDWHATLQQKSDQVLNQLRGDEKTKGLVVRRKSKNSKPITVVTDRELFIRLMQERGAELRDKADKVQPGELMISQRTVKAIFRGSWKETLQQKSDQVLNQLRGDEKTKGLVVRRRSKNGQDPTVVTDPEVFIQLMIERGVELKPKKE